MIQSLTKAQVLIELKSRLNKFEVPDLLAFTLSQLAQMGELALFNRVSSYFCSTPLIVRSSAADEDGILSSKAGAYKSVLNVNAEDKLALNDAVRTVTESYATAAQSTDHFEIIFQTLIERPALSGVVFTHDMNTGAPYYVINYDDVSGLTDSVTSGGGEYSNRTLYIHRGSVAAIRSERFKNLIIAVQELEEILESEFLDIEFALDQSLKPYLFQVRAITTHPNWNRGLVSRINSELEGIQSFVAERFSPSEGVYGKSTIFGQMPDWNPAELIGRAPRALSLSLYRYLITDDAWRDARETMGYAVPPGQPLMVSLAGQPFIDTRLSFHSYLPASLPQEISIKLVDSWIERLRRYPELHDKVEFDVAITTFSFDLDDRINLLADCLDDHEKSIFRECLIELTRPLLQGHGEGSIASALDRINRLSDIELPSFSSGLVGVNSLVKNCVRYGTIPFAILARHGFIARTLLLSLLSRGVINQDAVSGIQSSVRTVAGEMIEQINQLHSGQLSRHDFMQRYGHLRPGTYDILSPRYDQTDSFAVSTKSVDILSNNSEVFQLSTQQREAIDDVLNELSLPGFNCNSLLKYVSDAIAGREYGKFVFTRSVSAVLELIANYGESHGLSREEMSHVPFQIIQEIGWATGCKTIEERLRRVADENATYHAITSSIRLPQVLYDEAGVHVVPFQISHPNFITSKKISAEIVDLSHNSTSPQLTRRIVLIENADPGYDWIFSQSIAGLVTKYGGVNSHMAIRCAEFGIPAAIGCGEQRFDMLTKASRISLDCAVGLIMPLN